MIQYQQIRLTGMWGNISSHFNYLNRAKVGDKKNIVDEFQIIDILDVG